MPAVYQYQARSKTGQTVNGVLEAENSTQVARQLKERGYYVTSISKKAEQRELGEYFRQRRRVKTKDLAVFSQQFSAMIDAGISLVDALNIMEEQTDHPRLKKVINTIQERVATGSELSEAISAQSDVFPPLYCQMIKAGETGGVIDRVLANLAEHYERQDEINGKVKSALYYPLTVLVVASLIIVFLISFVVPQFVEMFAGMGAELPLLTRLLITVSDLLIGYWWAIILLLLGLLTVLLIYKKTPAGQYLFDRFKLKAPVIGSIFQKIYLSRFAGTMAILLSSGVDLLASLSIVEGVIGNEVYARLLTEARLQVREGLPLSRPLSEAREFPSMVVQMIKVGEEAGSLEKMLIKITDFYNREVAVSVEGMISLIEPLMIVLMAIVGGGIIIAIALPMFEMFNLF